MHPSKVHWWAVIPVLIVVAISLVLISAGVGGPHTSQANVEFWFRLLYECLHGGCYHSPSFADLSARLAELWVIITWLGYIVAIFAIGVIVYCTVRLHELRHREEEELETVIGAPEAKAKNMRFEHVQSLIGSTNPSDWRQAIIEADIMLDDVLTAEGYEGDDLGERLKSIPRGKLGTLSDAWEAHKVRNEIAHAGSAFDLSETLARRTIARYEAVFRELGAI